MEQPSLDPLLVAWLPPPRGLRQPPPRDGLGRQFLITEGDPDVWVEPAEKGWVQVWSSSRGNRDRSPEIEGRFDVVQRWIAWSMAPARTDRSGTLVETGPVLPALVPAPDTAFTTRVEDDFTTSLLEHGERVARLSDYSPAGALTNQLTHIVDWPLPLLLQQLDLAAQPTGGIFRRRTEKWPPRRIALTKRARWERATEQSRREARRLRVAARALIGR